MELRHLRYFVAVADEKHYGKAARKVFISQPTLSQQIQQLENEIGVELFVRSTRQIARKVELTEAGFDFLVTAKQILRLSQKAIDDARKTGLHQQTVRLGIYKITLRERIVEMIGILKNHFPDVDIKLIEYPNPKAVEQALIDENLDLGLIILPKKQESLTAEKFKDGHLCVMMHKDNPLANEPILLTDMLREAKWVDLNQEIHPFYEEIEEVCKRAGFSRKHKILQEVSSLELMSSLVNMGIGVAFVSSQYDLSRETNIIVKPVIMEIDKPQNLIEINNGLAYKSDRDSPLLKALINLLKV